MRTKDVPQDHSILGEHRKASYAVDENGRYVVVPTKGWEVERIVNAQAIGEIREHIEQTRQQALRGKLSPLAYHMARCHMNPALLAANSGVWRWRIKRHLTPKGFMRAPEAVLQRYADALGMSLEALHRVPEQPEREADTGGKD